MRTLRPAGLVAAVALLCTGCAGHDTSAPLTSGSPRMARIELELGPGAPQGSTNAQDTLHLASAATALDVILTVHKPVKVDLPAGVYTVRAVDGRACVTNLHVNPGGITHIGILYPTSQCQDMSPPPDPAMPPPDPATPATGIPRTD